MSEPFIGQISMFAGNFAPRSWAFCDGQLLPISQNQALFSLLGTIYGGDGRTTFALPDLRGRMPMHPGFGPGLSSRSVGEKGGRETVALTPNELPAHDHQVSIPASTQEGESATPTGRFPATGEEPAKPYASTSDTALGPAVTSSTGGAQPHDNMPPFQCIYFIIALVGIFPSRN